MSIVDELKKLIDARGGSAAGVHTIADAVKVLTALETETSEPVEDNGDDDGDDDGK